jgi:hypothetical protein
MDGDKIKERGHSIGLEALAMPYPKLKPRRSVAISSLWGFLKVASFRDPKKA